MSNESINGKSLLERFDESDIEQKLGTIQRRTIDNKDSVVEYATERFILHVKVDKESNIIEVGTGLIDASLETNRGLTKKATFTDVVNAYRNHFVKKPYKDFMGSGDGCFIIYTDQNHRIKMSFEFNELDYEKLSDSLVLVWRFYFDQNARLTLSKVNLMHIFCIKETFLK